MKTTHFQSFLCLISFVAGFISATADVITADFNSSDWSSFQTGAGSVSTAPDGRGFTITFPADAAGMAFEAGFVSTFSLANGFIMEVDYRLSTWPANNGVRVGIGMEDFRIVSRASNQSYDPMWTEAYAFGGSAPWGETGIVTTDTSGTFGIKDSTKYVFAGYLSENGGAWTYKTIGIYFSWKGPVKLSAWSDDRHFGDKDVVVEFSNLRITGGTIIPGNKPAKVPEPAPFMDWALLLLLPFGAQGTRLLGRGRQQPERLYSRRAPRARSQIRSGMKG